MSTTETELEDEDIDDLGPQVLPRYNAAAKSELEARCKLSGIELREEVLGIDERPTLRLRMKCGRDERWLYLGSDEAVRQLLSVPFERYIFLSGFEAIASYQDDLIEAAVRPIAGPSYFVYRNMFGADLTNAAELASFKIALDAPQHGLPRIEFSPPSNCFNRLVYSPRRGRFTLKLMGGKVTTHDQAVALLKKASDAVFFQIDLLSNIPLGLERERRRNPTWRRVRKRSELASSLQYPKTEFDDAPVSLYWYARSATGMPLLQFLAFYQTLEFYLPTYSQAEAQRKLKAVLKDPTFRPDRDADVGRLLSTINVSRSGAYGDERSQLRATLIECVDREALRVFLVSDEGRKEFYSSKAKSQYHKIPLGNPDIDLRTDVADRIYDIRCKIVHTKSDSRDGAIELLLPFTKEAEQLSFDIELVQYLAQSVLIAASTPFQGS